MPDAVVNEQDKTTPFNVWNQSVDEPQPFRAVSHSKQRLFLLALSELGNVVKACSMSGCSRQAVFYWRKGDPHFAAAFHEAYEMGAENLEAEAQDRACRPQFPSDTLLMFLLKGAMPAKYGDKSRLELTGANGGPLKLDYSKLTDEQLAQLEQLVALATAKPAEIEAQTVEATSTVIEDTANATSDQPGHDNSPADSK